MPGRPRLFAPVIVVVLLVLIAGGIFVSVYTDYLWFKETGFNEVFSTVLKTKILLFAVFGALMAAVIGANLAVAYRMRPGFQPMSLEQQNLERYRVAIEPFLLPVLLLVSAIFGIFAGLSAAGRWRTYLLFANAQPFGKTDPQFHKDISYFTFTYPFQRFILTMVIVVLVLSLIVSAITHYLFGGVRLQTAGEKISVAARVHLSVLVGLIVLAKAVGYYLDRYGLVFSSRGFVQGGLSYTDEHAVLPAKSMLALIAIICALLFFANIWVRNVTLPAGALALMVVSAIAVGGIYPAFVQRFQVKPNEVSKEKPYIDRNIKATREAYQIADVAVTQYPAVSTADKSVLRGDKGTIPNARLLDPNILGPAFKKAQGIRNYFNFNDSLDIDRYTLAGATQDYIVAARELDQSQLKTDQRNWINLHLTYTHGNGFVAAPANTSEEGLPSFVVKDIPPVGPGGPFALKQSQIYYGEESPDYSIVDTKQLEIDGPGGNNTDQASTTYAGSGGVKLNTGFRKLLYALKFKEKNILLSSSLTKDSKLMYIRSPKERVQKVAPFLQLDSDPYPAIVDGQLLWIVDGYTTSSGYPYSERTQLGEATSDSRTANSADTEVNYIRNSVKATVNAYTGKVTLYTWDEKDPVLKTWKAAFPGMVKDKSAIDAVTGLAEHFRYPEDYFKVQRELLAQYHVTDAKAFYNKEDYWQVPADPTKDAQASLNTTTTTTTASASNKDIENNGPAQPPYYVLLQFPGQPTSSFSLTSTFVARGSSNLTAFASVSSDPSDYGKIRVLQLPKNTVVPGPGQVANQFESSTIVAQRLLPLRQSGSNVLLGNLLTLPVGQGLLYVEPVYAQAKTGTKYPILNSVILSFGEKIAFQPTLGAALDELFGTGTSVNVSPGTTPSPGTSGPTLSALAQQAQQAYDDGQKALQAGDFAAYGVAQKKLKAAIDALAKKASPTASPTPSPSATP